MPMKSASADRAKKMKITKTTPTKKSTKVLFKSK